MKKIGFLSQWEKIISEITYFFKLSNKQPFSGKRRKKEVGRWERRQEGKKEVREESKGKEKGGRALFVHYVLTCSFTIRLCSTGE